MRLRRRAFVLSAVALLAGVAAGCGAPPSGPELRTCEKIDLPERAADVVGRDDRVAVCGSQAGTHAIVVTHDASVDEAPWEVWLVNVRKDSAERAMRVTGSTSTTDDGLGAWHEAFAAGFSRRGDEAIVGDVRVTEHSDGSDEPAHRQRAGWWAIDIGDGSRRELARDSYDVDDLRE